jgi:hypothetical protein
MLALAEAGQRRIVTADWSLVDLREEIRLAKPGQTPWRSLPVVKHDELFSRLLAKPLSKLLVPDSGPWPVGSVNAKQTKALLTLLKGLKNAGNELLDLTPQQLAECLWSGAGNVSNLDKRSGYFSLRLITRLGKSSIGAKLCYDLTAQAQNRFRPGVTVTQSLHVRELGELVPQISR